MERQKVEGCASGECVLARMCVFQLHSQSLVHFLHSKNSKQNDGLLSVYTLGTELYLFSYKDFKAQEFSLANKNVMLAILRSTSFSFALGLRRSLYK
jgi:hypothetical protein